MNQLQRFGALLAVGMALSGGARAVDDKSAMTVIFGMSVVPVASVAIGASTGTPLLSAAPLALLTESPLVVKSYLASGEAAYYVMEGSKTGVTFMVDVGQRAAAHASDLVGATIAASATGSGVVLSAAGEAIAFIPNESGVALLHHERLTD